MSRLLVRKLCSYRGCMPYVHRCPRRTIVNSTSEWQDDGEETINCTGENYPGHVPTSVFQKTLLSIGAAGMAIINPARDDMIAALGETTGYYALQNMRRKMQADDVGRQILEERPIINTHTVDINYLGTLPDDTFGKAYWRFLDDHGFSPDARAPVRFVDDPELMYIMLRYRQCHDMFHTVTGMPPNMLGEVVVKWIEAIQTGLPMCVMGALMGPVRFGPRWQRKYLQTYLPWAIKCGSSAKFLMAVYYEKHWEQNLEDLRRELDIIPLPVTGSPRMKDSS
ncbi:ubiquinone biosynthesis protein COQ4 homolog, mitochondrial-like [Liolophura sinensis]|uniref:ubiquinone biosynthesis protein COQ4 homolog, mitochondrial-like n=1 Tax=Liolophura sinensis TaxID=3198878 RepID=UPI0031589527